MYNELAIKQLVATQGWKEVEKMFIDEVVNNSLPKEFATKGKSAEQIALECMAREYASDMVTNVLNKVKGISNKKVFEEEKYI